MSDVSPERDWFEKADQDLEMACRALGPEKPVQRTENILKKSISSRSSVFSNF